MAIIGNGDASVSNLLGKLKIYIFGLAVAAVAAGGVIGYLVAGRAAQAQDPGNTTATAEYLSASFARVARTVEPAVVNIDVKGRIPEVAVKSAPGETDDSGDEDSSVFDFLQRQFPRRPVSGVGSGFIIDAKGYILTNQHVVADSSRITVRLQNGDEYVGTVVGTDEETDLAVVKINASAPLPTVRFGDSNAVEVGDWALAIGSPFGLAQSVTAGIISQVGRETQNNSVFRKFIQTDAAINKGNSGGPLVNMRGEVIGINSQIASVTGDFSGIGFSLPSNEAAYVYQQILASGKVKRGYMGVGLESLKPQFGKVYQMPELKGAVVTNIQNADSPAGRSGLKPGDIITGVDGKEILGSQDLISRVASIAPETEITLTYYREAEGNLQKGAAKLKLGERPTSALSASETPDAPKKLTGPPAKPWNLNVVELTPALAALSKYEGLKGALVKGIEPSSFLADVGDLNGQNMLLQGDLIQRVNRQPVANVAEFTAAITKLKAGDPVVLHIARTNSVLKKAEPRLVQFTVQ